MKEAQDFSKSEFVVSLTSVRLLSEYLHHTSWRCGYYDKCFCGLDSLTDELGLERVLRRDLENKGLDEEDRVLNH